MSAILRVKAVEKSTYVVTATFQDTTGAAVVPATPVNWILSDAAGLVITTGSVPAAASVDIVLSGDNLIVSENFNQVVRVLTIETTYNSNLGNGMPLKGAAKFNLQNLVAIQ